MIVRFRLGNITETRPVHGKLDHHVSAGRNRDGFKQLHVSVVFTKYGNTLFRPVKSIFFATTTTIHIFGLIKVTATITPVDSESNNYVYDKVKTPGSSTQALQLLKLGKSTNKNYENIILTVKHGMNLIFLFCFA